MVSLFEMQPSLIASPSRLSKTLTYSSTDHGTYRTTEKTKEFDKMYITESEVTQTKAGWEQPSHEMSGTEMRRK